jgi:hypothetical protein
MNHRTGLDFCRRNYKEEFDRIIEINKAVYRNFGLNNFPNKKECWKKISYEIHKLKRVQKDTRRQGSRNTREIDYLVHILSFGSRVLMKNYEINHGWKSGGWMNNGPDEPEGTGLFL